MARQESERMRAAMRREAQERRNKEKHLKKGLTREFLEDTEELPMENPHHKYHLRSYSGPIGSDISSLFDSSDEETIPLNKTKKPVRRRIISDDEDDVL